MTLPYTLSYHIIPWQTAGLALHPTIDARLTLRRRTGPFDLFRPPGELKSPVFCLSQKVSCLFACVLSRCTPLSPRSENHQVDPTHTYAHKNPYPPLPSPPCLTCSPPGPVLGFPKVQLPEPLDPHQLHRPLDPKPDGDGGRLLLLGHRHCGRGVGLDHPCGDVPVCLAPPKVRGRRRGGWRK